MRNKLLVVALLAALIAVYFGHRIYMRAELKKYDQRIAVLEVKKMDAYQELFQRDQSMTFDEADKRKLLLNQDDADELAELRRRAASLKADGITDPSD